MARKKRTDEEAAAAGGAAAAAAAQQAAGTASKAVDTLQATATKSMGPPGQQRQSRRGAEGLSRGSGGAAAAGSEALNGGPSFVKGPGVSAASDIISKGVPAAASGGAAGAAPAAAAAALSAAGEQQRQCIDTAGMSSSRKKNLRRKLRRQEQRQQEAELHNALQLDSGAAASLASRLNGLISSWGRRVSELESSLKAAGAGGAAPKQVLEAAEKLQREIVDTQAEETGKARKPINKRASVQHVQEKIKEVELAIQKQQKEVQRLAAQEGRGGGSGRNAESMSSEERSAESQLEDSRRYLAHLREQLVLTQQQSDLRVFQQQASELKVSLEHIAKQAQRAAQQGGPAADPRRAQQREAAWRRRLQDLGAAPLAAAAGAAGGAAAFVTSVVSLPADASYVLLTPQGQPSLMLRKVERKFGVLAEKKGSGDRSLVLTLVAYDQAACDSCAAFLSESCFPQVPLGFETASNCFSLEGQPIGAFIGTGGANLRRLEAEHDVLLWLEDKWITVLGREAAVKSALPHLKEARSPTSAGEAASQQVVCEFASEMVRALAFGGLGLRSLVQQLEKSHGVSIASRPGRRGEPSRSASVLVRGPDLAACKKAAAELEEAFRGFESKVIECDRMKANRLLRDAAVDFTPLEGHELVSLLRCDEGVLVIAPSSVLPAAVEIVAAASHQLARATEKIEIKATQLRILDRVRRSEIETLSGATCRPPIHDGENATLTFTGHPDAVQKALELAQQILEEQKKAEVELSIAAALLFLLEKNHRALEEEHGIRIRVDVPRERVVIRGSGGHEAVSEAVKKMEEEVVSSGKVAVKVDVPRESVALILGRQASNLRRLQTECNLDNIVVDGRPQAVYMLGTQAAVDQATAMVQEIVSGGGARQQNGADGAADRRPRTAGGGGGRGGGRGGRMDVGGRGGGGASRGRGGKASSTPSKPYNVSADDENAFPSLGVCMTRPGGRWQKKSPAAPEAECEAAAAKATSDELEAAAECIEVDGEAN